MKENDYQKKFELIESDLMNLKSSIDRGEQSTIKDIQEYLDEILEDNFGFIKVEGKNCYNHCTECKHYGCLSKQTHWDPSEWGCSIEHDLNDSNYVETKEATYCKQYATSYEQ